MSCPCGLGETFEACCGPFISGDAAAPTAEKLMRSRYTAYVVGAIDYVVDTNDPKTSKDLDRSSVEDWSKNSTWHGLEVVSTDKGGEGDTEGTVEFIARFNYQDEDQEHHENAHFVRRGERWFYLDGKVRGEETFVREDPKVGRNDPCPCGSGKKFKRCCGKA